MIKRKKEHLDLALHSRTERLMNDERFDYEPLLSRHPDRMLKPIKLLGKKMLAPVWISSMTGGSEFSGAINRNLARACNEFGLGMGLGSCRALLDEGKYRDHFDLRGIIGPEYPFYANLGIKQIEISLKERSTDRIMEMIHGLQADGLIIHVNPIQEWLQPEGEEIRVPPLETIIEFMEHTHMRIVVKEVGQGMGPESLREILKLPLEALELAAFGGTNFATVELKRTDPFRQKLLEPLSYIGNDPENMIGHINHMAANEEIQCKAIIISGGLKDFLDGYYLMKKCNLMSVYGQASAFLRYAREDYEQLREFIRYQIDGLKLAYAYLRLRK